MTFFDDVARDGGVQKGISYRTVSNFLRSSDDSDGKGGGQLKRDAFVINEDSEGSWGRGLHDNSGELWKDSSSSLADLDSRHRNRRQRHPEHHQSGSQTSDVEMNSAVMNPQLQSPLLRFFNRAAVFTVWRPCSPDAIRAMMTGVATGKGLDVKGKSAKRGELSGYVPFVQIHDEDDKRSVGYVPDGVRMRCFYGREVDRDRAVEHLMKFAADCVRRDEEHEREVDDDDKESRKDWLSDGSVVKIDKYAPSTPALGARLLVGSLSSDDADISDGEAKVEYGDNNNVAVRISKIAKHSSKKGSSKDMPSTKEPCWGLECLQSLFWEGIVRSRPVGRPAGSDLDTGRPSEPAFQDMNLRTVRIAPASSSAPASASASSSSRGEPAVTHTTVVWQPEEAGNRDPLDPRTLLVAYEERGRVLPVVSDFDCFIVGTRGVPYDRPLPMEQVGLLNWSVDRVGGILDAQAERRREREERKQRRQQEGQNSAKRHSEQLPVTTEETEPNPKPEPEPEPEPEEPEPSWTSLWLDVLKRASSEPKSSPSHVPIPRFGYGDGTSYSMMGRAVERLECGAVRHGAECFNYKFPQEIDHQFLVVSDTLPGPVPWKYVSEPELRELLAKKANEGFSFPLNPKWVLCDPGWKDVYDKLINSEDLNVKRSMATWFPPVSGVRRRIEEVCERHPRGFLRDETAGAGRAGGGRNTLDVDDSGTEAMDLAELQLGRYLALQRAKRKLRTVLLLRRIGMEASVHRSDQNEGGGIDDRDGDKDGDRHRATEEENETAEADEVVTEIRSGSASFASVNARVCT
uniref:Uncharacterized protein n=1 Tax=Odontella aurita TaxID=265563 RepID=A0A7S4IA38_9STRA